MFYISLNSSICFSSSSISSFDSMQLVVCSA